MNKFISPLLMALALAGCARGLPPEEVAKADFGPKPPANYQELIKADIAPLLVDPTAPLYTFTEPGRGYFRRGREPMIFGWKVCGTLNSKNQMGGYSGPIPFFTLIRDGKVVVHNVGEQVRAGLYGVSFVNKWIVETCNRVD